MQMFLYEYPTNLVLGFRLLQVNLILVYNKLKAYFLITAIQEEINPNHIQSASFVIHQVKVCDMPENKKRTFIKRKMNLIDVHFKK